MMERQRPASATVRPGRLAPGVDYADEQVTVPVETGLGDPVTHAIEAGAEKHVLPFWSPWRNKDLRPEPVLGVLQEPWKFSRFYQVLGLVVDESQIPEADLRARAAAVRAKGLKYLVIGRDTEPEEIERAVRAMYDKEKKA